MPAGESVENFDHFRTVNLSFSDRRESVNTHCTAVPLRCPNQIEICKLDYTNGLFIYFFMNKYIIRPLELGLRTVIFQLVQTKNNIRNSVCV